MKKRKLSNLNLKKSTVSNIGEATSKIGGAPLHSRHGNYYDETVEDVETYEGLGWMSLPHSHCC